LASKLDLKVDLRHHQNRLFSTSLVTQFQEKKPNYLVCLRKQMLNFIGFCSGATVDGRDDVHSEFVSVGRLDANEVLVELAQRFLGHCVEVGDLDRVPVKVVLLASNF